ncbi:UCP3 protein, partial [Polypterus senegalus]
MPHEHPEALQVSLEFLPVALLGVAEVLTSRAPQSSGWTPLSPVVAWAPIGLSFHAQFPWPPYRPGWLPSCGPGGGRVPLLVLLGILAGPSTTQPNNNEIENEPKHEQQTVAITSENKESIAAHRAALNVLLFLFFFWQIQGEKTAVEAAKNIRYRGVFGTITTMIKTEGPRSLYNGLVAGLQRQMGFASIRIGLYDTVKQFYMNGRENASIGIRILAGCTTGAMAVSVAQPTDVVKVRFQAQMNLRGVQRRYKGTLHAYKTIFLEEGVRGLWKGTLPNITRNAIVNCAELVTYDIIKEAILKHNLMTESTLGSGQQGGCTFAVTSPTSSYCSNPWLSVEVFGAELCRALPPSYRLAECQRHARSCTQLIKTLASPDTRTPHSVSRVPRASIDSAKITASSAKSRSVNLSSPTDATQPLDPTTLPNNQSMQALNRVGAEHTADGPQNELEKNTEVLHGFDFVLKERLLMKTRMRHMTCIEREGQIQHCGHVTQFPEGDSARRILIAGQGLRVISGGWDWTTCLPGGLPTRILSSFSCGKALYQCTLSNLT